MKIGIIGSSLSGLVAGQKLASVGHNVTLFEQSSKLGSYMATKNIADGFFDYGLSSMLSQGEEFKAFVDELTEKNVLFQWAHSFKYYNGSNLLESHPHRDEGEDRYYASRKGINNVTNNLKRWLEIEASVRVGGLTFIGPETSKKRSWMVNLTNINVFECDAVIVATDAVNAMAILNTAQNRTATRRLSRYIDEVSYLPRYSLMASLEDEAPSWPGIVCDDSILKWIGNDSSKNKDPKGTQLSIQSNGLFAEKYEQADDQTVINTMATEASKIIDKDIRDAETDLHFWKFYEPNKLLNDYYMELEMEGAPLALVGDYFNEWSAESAYLSGLYLAEYWISKFKNKEKTVTA